MARLVKLLVVAVVVCLAVQLSFAANPDQFVISVTPTIDYSVEIDTTQTDGIIDTSLDLSQNTVMSGSVTVRNIGTTTADWTMRGNALGNWTIASAPGNNAARILAMFSDKQYMDLDTEWHETNDALVENTSRDCDDITNHTDNGVSGDDVANGTERKLFLRIDAPTDSDYDTAQTFRVTITAVASSTF